MRRPERVVATTAPIEVADSRTLARNRQEDRRVKVYAAGSALDGGEWGPLVAAVICITRQTMIRSAAIGLWRRREETAFYASSVMRPAETFAGAIRSHWATENQNHWLRDVALAEDASRIRINPGIMARLRSQALTIARANAAKTIADALWTAAIDPAVALSYQGIVASVEQPGGTNRLVRSPISPAFAASPTQKSLDCKAERHFTFISIRSRSKVRDRRFAYPPRADRLGTRNPTRRERRSRPRLRRSRATALEKCKRS